MIFIYSQSIILCKKIRRSVYKALFSYKALYGYMMLYLCCPPTSWLLTSRLLVDSSLAKVIDTLTFAEGGNQGALAPLIGAVKLIVSSILEQKNYFGLCTSQNVTR